MLSRDNLRLDLGLRKLLPEWLALVSPRNLRADLVAGVTVACVAVPLSLAIGLASGVNPGIGITTAIIAGIVCALFGGTPLAVSGPAAAMAVLIASVVEEHGLAGLYMVGLGCGLLQLLSGVLGLGRFVRYVPVPVVAGFTAGIGAIIIIGQLPRALGLTPPDQWHVLDVLTHIGEQIQNAKPVVAAIALSSAAICLGLPKLTTRIPAPLVAVVLPSLAVALFDLSAPVIGEIPRALSLPRLPTWPGATSVWSIVSATMVTFALASLETLLSSTAIDKLSGESRHDSDQELIGQGLGNTVVAMFGGIPVTGVIARSALNLQAGAKTRRSAIIHSLTLIALVLFLAPLVGQIPLACLAGVLLAVALRMISVSEFLQLWKTARAEGFIYALTFCVILFFDLIAGIQVGLVAAFAVLAIRLGRTRVQHVKMGQAQERVSLQGPLTFLSSRALDPVRRALDTDAPAREIILDLSRVSALDVSGAEMLCTLVEQIRRRGTRVAILGLDPQLEPILRGADSDGHSMARLANTEREADGLLSTTRAFRPIDGLVRGVERFRNEEAGGRFHELLAVLADGQRPHTLFITCSDSRINPNLITSTDPGELFVVRNVGNIIPPFASDELPSEGAAIEFAVGILEVEEVVICAHSGCGAIKALLSPTPVVFPSLAKWLSNAAPVRERLGQSQNHDDAARANALVQVENLATYPVIAARLAAGTLRLHAWFFDIRSSNLYEWNESKSDFTLIARGVEEPLATSARVAKVRAS